MERWGELGGGCRGISIFEKLVFKMNEWGFLLEMFCMLAIVVVVFVEGYGVGA